MFIYKYDEKTKELLGYAKADLDPLATLNLGKEVYLIPPSFTVVEPGASEEGYTFVFNGASWDKVEDNRGLKVYDEKTGKEVIITELGKIPSNCQRKKPVIFDTLLSEKLREVDKVFEAERVKEIEIKGIVSSVILYPSLPKPDRDFPLIAIKDKIVKYEDLEECIKYFYLRSLLLVIKKKDVLRELNKIGDKKRLNNFIIDFSSIEDEIKSMMNMSIKEISNYIESKKI